MGGDEIIRIGATAFSADDLSFFAFGAGIAAAFAIFPWARWHWNAWRIGRARAQGRIDDADHLAFEHDEEAPNALSNGLRTMALVLLFVPGLDIFQENLADDVGRMLGKGLEWAGMPLAMGFVFVLLWMWDRIRRNMMSPEELAVLEEEEEHQRWLANYLNGSMLSPAALYLVFIATILAILALLML